MKYLLYLAATLIFTVVGTKVEAQKIKTKPIAEKPLIVEDMPNPLPINMHISGKDSAATPPMAPDLPEGEGKVKVVPIPPPSRLKDAPAPPKTQPYQ